MEISANPHQGTRTKTAVALPQLYSMPFGKPYQPLTATIEQPCIRGKAIAFSCTVVSMLIRSRLLALIAPLTKPACTVTCRISSEPCSPMRPRQRLKEEGSMGSS